MQRALAGRPARGEPAAMPARGSGDTLQTPALAPLRMEPSKLDYRLAPPPA